jgi:hypothetical protein
MTDATVREVTDGPELGSVLRWWWAGKTGEA